MHDEWFANHLFPAIGTIPSNPTPNKGESAAGCLDGRVCMDELVMIR
jgi:hypothetical protein